MRKTVLVLFVLLSAMAAVAATCSSSTYDTYIVSGFSCDIGDKTFSDFMYTATSIPPGFEVPAGSIHVTPITTAGEQGLQWSAPWNASTTTGVFAQDSLFQFNVMVNPGGQPITDLTLSIGGAGFAGTGEVVVDETACLGALLPNCTGGTIITLRVEDDSGGQNLIDSATFTGVTLISIDKDVEVVAGTNGDASLSVVTDTFSQGGTVPEPGTLSMLGIGALAVAGFVRRKINL